MSEQSATDESPRVAGDAPIAAPRVQRWTRRAPWLAGGTALVVVVTDQLSKLWAERSLTRGERIPVLGDALGVQLIYNPGAALSIGAGSTWIFTIATAIGVVAGLWYAWRVRSRAWALALGLILGGAVTHLGDRLLREPSFGQGHVVDFIAYFDWFIGNVADIAIVVGAGTFLVLTARGTTMRPEDTVAAEPTVVPGVER
ncbi:signal peptidase II [Micromonospora sagamiensis]|uniref:Lipoprotein signal peptidase n=1 Tax=Micromonospora sagamiensis TaxID=47875 RepID=A0A562WM86_9ACTN|nr:signal peptidase II [Micromonospora sagamiensis]TWJ31302.1 signal peptidase II [Micromonospora sagamiensis]BCL15653.1 lipoprotein signal peptidase [Micromonospora sagamiensis]